MTGKTIVVLGGGTGGIVAANELQKRLGEGHRIVLVDRDARYIFAPSLLWRMAGWRRPNQLVRDLRRLVRPGVEVMRAEAREIDPARQQVVTTVGTLVYDYLVVAVGADLAPEAVPGWSSNTYSFFDLDGATRLHEALHAFPGGRVAVVVSRLPFKCPAAPYEAALLIDDALRRRGVRRSTEIELFTPEALPMPVAGPVLGNAVKGMLEQRGIRFHPQVQLTAVEGSNVCFGDGRSVGCDLLAAVPPHRAPAVVRESPLANEAGWVPVDSRALLTRFANVYGVGDVTTITLANGKPLPKAGTFAHPEALVVAHRIAAELGCGRPEEFDGVGYCWIEMGGGRAGFAAGDFCARPDPEVVMRRPGRLWHWGKVVFERYWMGDDLARAMSHLALSFGSRVLGIPATL